MEGKPFNVSPKFAYGLDIGYVVYKMVPITGCLNEETKSILILLHASYFYFKTSVVVSDKG